MILDLGWGGNVGIELIKDKEEGAREQMPGISKGALLQPLLFPIYPPYNGTLLFEFLTNNVI